MPANEGIEREQNARKFASLFFFKVQVKFLCSHFVLLVIFVQVPLADAIAKQPATAFFVISQHGALVAVAVDGVSVVVLVVN